MTHADEPETHPFRAAVEAGDIDAAVGLLADDVVFHSPVAFKPYRGREMVSTILRTVITVFEDFRYVREIGAADDHALVFEARIGDRELTGCDFIHLNAAGKIDDFMVMIRPLRGVQALAEAMASRLPGA
ncbi:nuclear transport factor 2 family protein [Paractinoplanes ferrugineus]|uniref:Membrane protein n=1 Tax=Paractinoplanes ferrugineus TaxID=113564 RepID=A0A919J2A1_9ACTN|nr:nuclear transport factor 2 family protein [Actinoplanes ferrugineus]GIE11124.1 membrane protein [Actinoplanes ferrugineus]